ncbi:MAG: hypothetical protein Q9184_000486 [Pyrenodesmia sp. 2 TL-2023]
MAYNSSDHNPDEQDTDEQRAIRLQQIQLEALGTQRRDQISTDDFKDRNRDQLSLRDMERRRRVNQHGTTESAVATVEKDRLKGWNTAWNTLKDDGILEKGLEDINAGQSHRARLLAQSFPVHTPAPSALPPPSSALEEAQRFHLGATSRGRSNLRGGARGDSLTENAKRVRARFDTSSSAADASRTLGRKGENFKLVEPNQFMAYVNAGKKAVTATPLENATSASIASPAMQSSLTTEGPQALDGESGLQARAQPITESPTTLLLDTNERLTTEGKIPGRPSTYADDLLGMEIDEPQELPQPMELTTKTGNADLPLEEHRQLRAMEAQLASFLPYLTAMLPSEAVEKLTSVRSLLQQKLDNPGQAGSVVSQLPASNEPRSALPKGKELKAAPRGLASAVEQRTYDWKKQVIASTVNTKGSIFGEHVVRSRWTERHQHYDSTASAASSTGLVEGLKKLRLDDAQPAADSKVAKAAEHLTSQYATSNPFGSKPASGGPALPGLNRACQSDNLEFAAPTARPQMPDYVRSGYTIGDHGAAVRAQYLGSAPPPMNELHQEVLSDAASTLVASTKTATSSAQEFVVGTSQGPVVSRNHATTSTKPVLNKDPPRANDHRPRRKESLSSAGNSTISPGLGEDMIRPSRGGGIRVFSPSTLSHTYEPRPFVTPNRSHPPSDRPRPAAFLNTLQPARDPGAAARAQYSQGANSPPQQTEQSFVQRSPCHSHASQSTPIGNPSAAFTRQQYSHTELTGLREQAALASAQFESLPKAPKRAEAPQGPKGKKITDYFVSSSSSLVSVPPNEQHSQQPRYESGSNKPEFQQTKGPAPRPRPWLAESIKASDPGAAVRKQYGMN